MLFTEFRFFLFLGILLALYWALPGNRQRKVLLLLASYAFYGAWDWRFLSLIFLSTIVDYIVGLRLSGTADFRKRRNWVTVSLVVNLGLLGVFKYFNFFADSAVDFLGLLGWEADGVFLQLVLPVGISFYTFQTLSYTLDIYRNKLEPTRSLLDFSLFVAFFPQLVAGPIIRASDFLYQLDTKKVFQRIDYRWALMLFLVGFIKKACIADNLAPYVDAFFADPDPYGTLQAWLGVLAFSTQLYCDFSGYSDMAIATAGLFGFRLRDNFNRPFTAENISEFWHRWHISLSSWLRDYLYIPLGGSRGTRLQRYRNLMITMFLGGLWHGAAWGYIVWGVMHGAGLIAHNIWLTLTAGRFKVPVLLGICMTFFYWNITMVAFRAEDIAQAWYLWQKMFDFSAGATTFVPGMSDLVVALGLAVLMCLHATRNSVLAQKFWRSLPRPLFAVFYGAAFSLVVSFRAIEYQPFIYFQF